MKLMPLLVLASAVGPETQQRPTRIVVGYFNQTDNGLINIDSLDYLKSKFPESNV